MSGKGMKLYNHSLITKTAGATVSMMLGASVCGATSALATTPGGADILLPKPAEFLPALAAFLVVWFIMARFAWPSIVKMMEKRELKIKGDLDSAEQAKLKAEQDRKESAKTIGDAQIKAAEIIATAKREAEQEREHILADAQRNASGLIEKARDAITTERHKAMIELSGFVVDLSVEIAGKIIGNSLSEAQQRDLAEHYLHEVGAKHDEEQA